MDFPKRISTTALATLLSLNARTIGKLVAKGVLKRDARGVFDTVDSVAAYIAHRESVVAAEHGTGDYAKARADLYLERARTARIKREALESSLISVDAVVAFNTGIVGIARNRLLGVPSKLAAQLIGLKTAGEAEALVRSEVVEALNELSRLEKVAAK
jgi:phage terminase Nu1 subunit (DNA packaging protein)